MSSIEWTDITWDPQLGMGATPAHGRAIWPALESPKGGAPAEWPEDLRVREFPQ